MLDPTTSEISKTASILHEIASLIGSLAWPGFALFVFIRYGEWISQFLPVLTEKFRTVESIEALGVKLTTAKSLVQNAVNQPATMLVAEGAIPKEQVQNAEKLNAQLKSAGVDAATILVSVEEQITRLATEYASIRSSLPQGPQRTREMNRIMGGLRTLGIAAKPLLPKLATSEHPGMRLAAIAVLQTEPDGRYIHWLGERFSVEMPFVFFHAALALRQAALAKTFTDITSLREETANALAKIEGFKGGHPDADTINALEDTLRELQR